MDTSARRLQPQQGETQHVAKKVQHPVTVSLTDHFTFHGTL